nr:hypothetical protein [Brevundimonas naejangsanensis]
MTRSPASTTRESTTRIQVYVSDPRTLAALRRASRTLGHSLSETAARALTRGLARSPAADPDDRLLALDRALRRHMAVAQRDMQITQELIVELARAFFLRLPDAVIDEDPVVLASVERRIERLLDATAARLVAGGSAPSDAEPAKNEEPAP